MVFCCEKGNYEWYCLGMQILHTAFISVNNNHVFACLIKLYLPVVDIFRLEDTRNIGISIFHATTINIACYNMYH